MQDEDEEYVQLVVDRVSFVDGGDVALSPRVPLSPSMVEILSRRFSSFIPSNSCRRCVDAVPIRVHGGKTALRPVRRCPVTFLVSSSSSSCCCCTSSFNSIRGERRGEHVELAVDLNEIVSFLSFVRDGMLSLRCQILLRFSAIGNDEVANEPFCIGSSSSFRKCRPILRPVLQSDKHLSHSNPKEPSTHLWQHLHR